MLIKEEARRDSPSSSWSLLLDLQIVLKTAVVVLRRSNAY